jgi:hypothetical protein
MRVMRDRGMRRISFHTAKVLKKMMKYHAFFLYDVERNSRRSRDFDKVPG